MEKQKKEALRRFEGNVNRVLATTTLMLIKGEDFIPKFILSHKGKIIK